MEVESDWYFTNLPGAPESEPDLSKVENPTPVVGIGALCDIRSGTPTSRQQSFSVAEFVDLEDGRRVILHRDRGWTQSHHGGDPGEAWPAPTEEDLVETVLNVVLPDDDDDPDDHEWAGLARLAQRRGLDVTEAELRGLTYEVVLAPTLLEWLAGGPLAN